MSISTLSHRLVFPKANTLASDLKKQMQSAFELGLREGERLSQLSFRAIEANSRRLPEELRSNAQNYATNRALASAYYHAVSSMLLCAPRLGRFEKEEAKKIAARTQRLILQLALSVSEQGLSQLQDLAMPGWHSAFTGALSAARVAQACHRIGLTVRYPRPVVDVMHSVDLFASLSPEVHLAIQVKTGNRSKAFVVDSRSLGAQKHFWHGVLPLAKSAQKRGSRVIPVWATCSYRESGLDTRILVRDMSNILQC